jgi:hypothetical protein
MEPKSFGGLKSLQTIRHYPCAITEGSSGMPLIRGRLYPPARDSGKISLNPLRKCCLSLKSAHSTSGAVFDGLALYYIEPLNHSIDGDHSWKKHSPGLNSATPRCGNELMKRD